MIGEDSPILDFYPEEFHIDMNGKKMLWQGVALLPFIDQKRLLEAMDTKYPELTDFEHYRNTLGTDAIIVGSKHPLYDYLEGLYGKKKASEPVPLDTKRSKGIAGAVLPDESVPGSTFDSPLPSQPDIVNDESISASFSFPPQKTPHRSVLLPGAKLERSVLTPYDKDQVRRGAGERTESNGFHAMRQRDQSGPGFAKVDNRGGGGRGGYGGGGGWYGGGQGGQGGYGSGYSTPGSGYGTPTGYGTPNGGRDPYAGYSGYPGGGGGGYCTSHVSSRSTTSSSSWAPADARTPRPHPSRSLARRQRPAAAASSASLRRLRPSDGLHGATAAGRVPPSPSRGIWRIRSSSASSRSGRRSLSRPAAAASSSRVRRVRRVPGRAGSGSGRVRRWVRRAAHEVLIASLVRARRARPEIYSCTLFIVPVPACLHLKGFALSRSPSLARRGSIWEGPLGPRQRSRARRETLRRPEMHGTESESSRPLTPASSLGGTRASSRACSGSCFEKAGSSSRLDEVDVARLLCVSYSLCLREHASECVC